MNICGWRCANGGQYVCACVRERERARERENEREVCELWCCQ